MKAKLFVVLSLLALASLLAGAVAAQGPGPSALPSVPPAASAEGSPAADAQAQAAAALQGGSVMLIENVGQFADGARFQVRGGDHTLWLAEDALWVTVLEQRSEGAGERGSKGVVEDSLLHLRASAP